MNNDRSDRCVWLWAHGPVAAPEGTLVGWQDAPLADPDEERARVRQLAATIGRADRIFTSDRRRARQAARPLARAVGARVEVTPALREIDYGRWTGSTWADVQRRDPEAHARYMAAWQTTAMPGGESHADLQGRVSRWWRSLRLTGPIVVVGHTGSLRALAAEILGWGPEDAMGVVLARGHYAVLDADGVAPPRWNQPLLR